MAIFCAGLINAQNLHMVNGNASDYGFDFNSNTGEISNLFFTFGEDDGYAITDDFTISWGVQSDPNDFGTYEEMDRIYFTQVINAYSSFVINSWPSFNLNNNLAVADGDYLLVGIVDTDDDISEFNESATDNGMFLAASASETITYTSGGATAIQETTITESNIYPNPVENIAQVSFTLKQSSDVGISIYDLSGKLVSKSNYSAMQTGKHIVQFSTSDLNSGIYYTEISDGTNVETQKLVKR